MNGGLASVIVFGLMLSQGAEASGGQAGHAHPQSAAESALRLRVTGVVVDAVSGQALSQARVTLRRVEERAGSSDDGNAPVYVTDKEGRFVFEGVAAERYQLSAKRKGYVEQDYKQHGSFSTAIVVAQDLKTEDLRFELTPGASIVGQVVDEMGEGTRDGQITLLRRGIENGKWRSLEAGETSADDRGGYRFDHLKPGEYFVVVSARPWYAAGLTGREPNGGGGRVAESGDANTDVTYATTYFPSAVDFGAASPIELHAGDVATANVALSPVPAVHFQYRIREDGGEERTAIVSVTQTIGDGIRKPVSWQSGTGSDGIEYMEGLPPGNLEFVWDVKKGTEETTRTQTIHFGSSGEMASTDEGATATVTGTMQAELKAGTHSPLISIRNVATGVEAHARPGTKGDFSFRRQFAAGTYEVSLPQEAGANLGIAASGAKVVGTTIEIAAGQDVELKIVASVGAGSVTGVTVKDGKAVDGVMVLLVPEDFEHAGSLMRIDQSDSDGSFNLARVAAGKYTVVAVEGAWGEEWGKAEFLRRFLAKGKKVEVEGAGKVRVEVEVQR